MSIFTPLLWRKWRASCSAIMGSGVVVWCGCSGLCILLPGTLGGMLGRPLPARPLGGPSVRWGKAWACCPARGWRSPGDPMFGSCLASPWRVVWCVAWLRLRGSTWPQGVRIPFGRNAPERSTSCWWCCILPNGRGRGMFLCRWPLGTSWVGVLLVSCFEGLSVPVGKFACVLHRLGCCSSHQVADSAIHVL